jgi:ribosomal protein L16 Arg81 hydroxylase
MRAVDASFRSLIDPVDPDEFLAHYWEKRYLHLERGQAGLYDHLFSLNDVDRWILGTKTDDVDGIVMAPPEGSEVSFQRFRTGELPIETAYDAFAKGHSLILNRLESTWYPLSPLTETLGELFSARVGVNAYLTPAGSRAFPVHVDYHDAFILQVHGEKVWRLHELEHLPVHQLYYRQDLDIPGLWEKPGSSPLLAEVRLRPGDLLYIPRGMPHCAAAKDDSSLHLTFSINTFYWLDLLKIAVEQACFGAPFLRRALPPRFLARPEIREEMREGFAAAMRDFQEKASFDDALQVAMRRILRLQGFPKDGHMAQLLRLGEIRLDSVLEKRPGILCMVECLPGGNVCKILFAGRAVQGPVRLRAAMELIRDRDRFRVAELPGLGDESKPVLARRLVREGLLRLAGDPVAAETGGVALPVS